MTATTGKEARLAKLARDFSKTVNASSARINGMQKSIIEKAAAKAEADERALKRRIGLARSGLRRLMAFGTSPALKRIVKTMSRMPSHTDVEFFELQWAWIGGQPSTTLNVYFETDGVQLVIVDAGWVRQVKTFFIPYVGQEVLCENDLDDRAGKSTLSLDDFLKAIATLDRVDFADLLERESSNVCQEEDVLFEVLISWARRAAFERAVMDCLQHLEQALERAKLRAA